MSTLVFLLGMTAGFAAAVIISFVASFIIQKRQIEKTYEEKQEELKALYLNLRIAISEEDYETAADVRDKINNFFN